MMFRRSRPDKNFRRPTPAGSAPVFSYYASRSPGETGARRQHNRPLPETRRLLSWQTLPVIAAAGVILAGLGYLLWLDTNPRIEVAEVSPGQAAVMQSPDTYQKAGRQLLATSPLNRLKLTVNTDKLAAEFKARFPELTEVVITTPLAGHRLIFKLQPTTPALALSPGNSEFIILDERGRAVLETDDRARIQTLNVPIVLDESGVAAAAGDTVLPTEHIRFITEVIKQLEARKIEFQSISLPRIANELHLRPANQQYYIKFNLAGEARIQTGAYVAAKQRLEGENKTPAEYIDVRTLEKVYYR